MSTVQELAKRFIPFTHMQKAAALISIGTVMMQNQVSAEEAASNKYDARRSEIMAANGVDLADVPDLIKTDPKIFLDTSPEPKSVCATELECVALMAVLKTVCVDTGSSEQVVMDDKYLDGERERRLTSDHAIGADRAYQLRQLSLEYIQSRVA